MAPVDAPATRLHGNNAVITGMNERSIILGSLSGSGRSISRWRRVTLSGQTRVNDFMLQLHYPPIPDPKFNLDWGEPWPVPSPCPPGE